MKRLSLVLCLLGLLVCLAVAYDQTAGEDELVVEAIGANGPVLDFLSFNSTNVDDQRLKRGSHSSLFSCFWVFSTPSQRSRRIHFALVHVRSLLPVGQSLQRRTRSLIHRHLLRR